MTTVVASTWPGIARACRTAHGTWVVDQSLRNVHVTALAAGTRESGVLWAASREGGVFRSADRGTTWERRRLHTGVAAEGIRAIAASDHDPDVVFVGTKPAGVLRSTDGGRTWDECRSFGRARRWWWLSPAEPPGWTPYVSALSISPKDPDVVLAGIEAGAVVRSEDGGLTWSDHCRSADRDCHALTFHATDGRWAYSAGGGGPAVSRDGGRRWRHAAAGLDGRYSVACAADPQLPEVWYVSASPLLAWPEIWKMPLAHVDGEARGAIYRRSGGASWTRLGGGLPQPLDHMAYGLATDPEQPGHVYAGLADGTVWHSVDHGDTWVRLAVGLGGVRRAFLVA